MNQVYFRQANEGDVASIRALVRNSEAIWGFSECFLHIFDEKYNVTADFVKNHISYVMTSQNQIVGFYGLMKEKQNAHLEYFYIESSQTRKGFGKILWKNMIDRCYANGIKRIDFVTSNPAVKFYTKCGAVLNGTTQSSIDGRDIPKLFYELNEIQYQDMD